MIWLKPGGGKTLIILTWLHMLKTQRHTPTATLLIGTELIIYEVWPIEIENFPKFDHFRCVHLHGDYMHDAKRIVKSNVFDIAFTTPDTLTRLINEDPKLFKHFKRLVVDESTKYKGWKSNRFKKIRKMLKSCTWIKQRVCMTGTPAPNGWRQLFTQFWIVGGYKVFNTDSFYDYQDLYFYQKPRDKFGWHMLPNAVEQISHRIRDLIFQPNPEEYREMPDLIEYEFEFDLPERIMKLHKQMQKDKYIKVKGKDILAANAGVSTFKCAQIASGAVYRYTDPNDPSAGREAIHLHNCKTDILEEIIDEIGGANCLILYSYHHDYDRIKSRFPNARDVARDKGTVKLWNSGRLPVMIGHPASMAHGLNLQFGGKVIIWYSTTPDAEYWEQAIKRLHRGEIDEPVYVYYIIARGTVDERFMALVRAKVLDQEELMLKFSGLH